MPIVFRAVAFVCALLTFLFSGCGKGGEKHLKIGDPAPSFSVKDIDGRSVSLDDYKGNPVILRFWSTDCKYCRADTPIFNQYFNDYKDRGLKVVYINSSVADSSEIREFVESLAIEFPVVLDKGGEIAANYNVRIVPQTIILGPDHRITAAILGGVSEAELNELLRPYLVH